MEIKNKCKICDAELKTKRARVCKNPKCASAWKMQRNKNLKPIVKQCKNCGKDFKTVDRRNNYCNHKCKYAAASKIRLEKYGYANPGQKPKSDEQLLKLAQIRQEKQVIRKEQRKIYYQNNKEKFMKKSTKTDQERRDYHNQYYKTEKGQELARRSRERRRQDILSVIT